MFYKFYGVERLVLWFFMPGQVGSTTKEAESIKINKK
jgi:hypothetical protein